MDELRITSTPYEEWILNLTVSAASDGYSGVGSGYLPVGDLIELADRLAEYPLDPGRMPHIAAGFLAEPGDPDAVDQLHFSLRAYPVGSRGQVGFRCELATPKWDHTRPEEVAAASLEILTWYSVLEGFASQLRGIAARTHDRALLQAVP